MMKKIILILLISFISILSYGQIVEVNTTLLTIDGISKGQLINTETIPLACEYRFVVKDTLAWTTIPIDSLQFENTQMKEDIIELKNQVIDLYNQLLNKVEYGDTTSTKGYWIIIDTFPETKEFIPFNK